MPRKSRSGQRLFCVRSSWCVSCVSGIERRSGVKLQSLVNVMIRNCIGLKSRQVSANKRVAQHVPDRRQNVRLGGGRIAAKRDQRTELIARLVLQQIRRSTHDRLPEKLQNIVFLDVLLQAENLQV